MNFNLHFGELLSDNSINDKNNLFENYIPKCYKVERILISLNCFSEYIYHQDNISRLPDFDVTLLDIRKRNKWSYCKHKNRNLNRKNKHTLTLSDLSIILKPSGRYMAFSRLFTLSFASLRNLDIEDNQFYDRAHRRT